VTSLLTVAAYTKQGVGAYNFAILISTATNLVIYVLCTVAVIRFMNDGRVPRTAGLVICCVIALAFSAWAIYGSGTESLLWGSALIAVGFPIYVVARRSARRGADAVPARAAV
jgi:APA family basic amino acid/polyamine antiporter